MNVRFIVAVVIILMNINPNILCASRASFLARRMRISPLVSNGMRITRLPGHSMAIRTPMRHMHWNSNSKFVRVCYGFEKACKGIIAGGVGKVAGGIVLGGIGRAVDDTMNDKNSLHAGKFQKRGITASYMVGGASASRAAGPLGVAAWITTLAVIYWLE
jgi:hypothetical protein